MKKLIVMTLVAAACSTTVFAQSANNLYGEVAYSMVNAKDTSTTDNLGTFKTSVARFTLGSVVANNVAVEGFIAQGLASDSKVINGLNVELKNKTAYGIAVRPFFQATQDIEVFGRLGTMRSESESTVSAGNFSQSNSGKKTNMLYGVGAAYKINKDMSATLDYTKLSKKDDLDTSLLSVGIRFNF